MTQDPVRMDGCVLAKALAFQREDVGNHDQGDFTNAAKIPGWRR